MHLLSERPIVSRRAFIKYDRLSGGFLLLAPERGLVLNRTAHEVLELCGDGTRSLGQLLDELYARYPGVAVLELERDVRGLFDRLERHALMRFSP